MPIKMRNYFLMAFCGQYPANHFRNPLAGAVDDDDDDDDDTTRTRTRTRHGERLPLDNYATSFMGIGGKYTLQALALRP